MRVYQSDNMVNWTSPGRIFNGVPQWLRNITPNLGDLWAPHITEMGGRYYAYYCGSEFGTNTSAIGCAVSNSLDPGSPDYGWTDLGFVIESRGQNFNAIDPEIIQDQQGNWWMQFGSFWQTGIRLVQINPNTGKRTSPNNTIHALADRNGGAIEGPSIVFHDGYYYLFVAYDKCCDGAASTYRTMVGRSQSITGPYRAKNGNDMRDNAATEVLSGYDRYNGTGHGSVFKDNKRDYFVHHYYDAGGFPRPHFREIVYGDDGWPILAQPFMGRRQAFEAEHAKITNCAWNEGNGASNNSYIGNINFADSRVRFDINALQGGTYNLRIRYAAGDGAASHYLSVNGQEQQVQYPATANWGQFPQGQTVTVPVNLKEGYNSLVFRVGTGFAELDRVDLIRSASTIIEAGSVDDAVGVSFNGNNNATLSSGSWSKIEYVDFGQGGFSHIDVTAAGNCNGTFDFSIDGRNGNPATNVSVNINAGQTFTAALPNAFSSLTGIHDVYYEYSGGACALDQIRFNDGGEAVPDCNGDVGGSAFIDDCGTCVSGNTGETACKSVSGNPIINPVETGRFSADPAALVHDGKVYVYVGRDEAEPGAADFNLNRWDVYSSCDMTTWTHEGSPLGHDSFSWAWGAAFAGHCVERDGKFYWYVPMLGNQNQGAGPYFSIGVAVSDNPTGPFVDAIGAPLLRDSQTPDVRFDIDPAVFVDDDGQAYMYWGNRTPPDGGPISPMKIAKLNDDMISIEEGSIKTVTLGNGDQIPDWTEAPYMHKKGDTYYLSYAIHYPEQIVYCTGPSPEGPWTYRGLINDFVNSETNHQSIIEYKGRDYFIYHNFYTGLGGDEYRRSVAIEELYYNADGTIQQIIQTTDGASAVPCSDEVYLEEGYYQISPSHSDLCMQSATGSPTQQTCGEAQNQIWRVIKDGDDYQLLNLESNQYWGLGTGVQGENTGMSSSPVSLTLTNAGGGNYYLSPQGNTSLVFDVLNVSTAEGEPVILWENTGAANQHFAFTEVDIPVDCNGDAYGTADYDACDVCVGGNSPNLSCTGSLEAEEICDVDGVALESTNTGFTGAGYVNTTNAVGAYATWGVNSTEAQTATLSFRYANNAANSRDGSISINGTDAGNVVLAPTGAWTTWETVVVNVQLEEGYNEIVVTATTAGGLANIDRVSFSNGVTDAQCGLITAIATGTRETITAYPTPTSGMLYLNTNEEVSWKLYNQIGQQVQEGKSTELDLSRETKGLYLLKVNEQIFRVVKD